MKSVGHCCSFEVFWVGFMRQWRVRFTPDADTPDFVVAKAKMYWQTYGMTGFEAAETIYRRIRAGSL